MPNRDHTPAELFGQALEFESEAERTDFLNQACANDPQLRAEVDRLLVNHANAGQFLQLPPVPAASTMESIGDGVGEQIGPYKIREKIGEGGMGVVYVAEQTEPVQRKVAIKVIKPGMDTKEVIARFEAERQALAFMEHPNIARVLDAGATESGRSYFVMELVRGTTITEYCDQVKATPSERLDLFKTVCDAVQHAHQKGIIHRDIKPSNVLVTQVGAKPVVKVIDFGLAKATSGQKLTDKTVYTGFMKLMGTPVYMSPEQAGLSGLDVDTRSDVYSLGVLLYELLTGTTPLDKTEIQRQAYDELCRQIQEVEAPKPSSRISTLKDAERSTIAQQRGIEPKNLRQLLDGDLDLVVLKALEKDRDRRYSTPQDLAADVDRFLADQPVLAVPPSSLYLARKYFRRHRFAILTAATMAVALLAAAGVSTWQAVRANQFAKDVVIAKSDAERARDEAVVARDGALASEQDAVAARKIADQSKMEVAQTAKQRRRELYTADMLLADHLWKSSSVDDRRRIDQLLSAWIPVDGQEDLREFSWRYQWTRLHGGAEITVHNTTAAAISPDGNLITADAQGLKEWVAQGSSAVLWSGGHVRRARLSADGRWAAIYDGKVTRLIRIADGKVVLRIPHDRCDFSPTGKSIAAWTVNTAIEKVEPTEPPVHVWSLASGTPQEAEPPYPGRIFAERSNFPPQLQVSDDGRSILQKGRMATESTRVRHHIWLFDAESAPMSLPRASAFDFTPDGKLLVHNGVDGTSLRLRSNPGTALVIPGNHGLLCFSPDSSKLAGATLEGDIELWDVSSLRDLGELAPSTPQPQLLQTIRAPLLDTHVERFPSIVFSTDGKKLATRTGGVVKLWDVSREAPQFNTYEMPDLMTGDVGLNFEERKGGVLVSEALPEMHEVVSGEIRVGDRITEASDDQNGTTRFHNQISNSFMQRKEMMQRLVRGPHGSVVRLQIENPNEDVRHVELRRTHQPPSKPQDLAFSDNMVAFADEWNGAVSLNFSTSEFQRYPVFGRSIAISPDGRYLAMTDDVDVVLWDRQLNRERCRLDGRLTGMAGSQMKAALTFSPDGKFLAKGTGWTSNDVKVWRVSNLEEVGPRNQHEWNAKVVRFTPDGSRLIAMDQIGEIRIWNSSTWEVERTIRDDSTAFNQTMAISNDGHTLVTSGDSLSLPLGRMVIWDYESGKQRFVLGAPSLDIALSPDGITLATSASGLWDTRTGKQLLQLERSADVGFSHDGNTLATLATRFGDVQLWKAAPLEEIESHPSTHAALLQLGIRHNEAQRFAEAESILQRLLEYQWQYLPSNHADISRTKTEIKRSLIGQGKMPEIVRQPVSIAGDMGDEITFSVGLAEESLWNLQWFRNGKPIDGATSTQLVFNVESESDFGAYRIEVMPSGRNDTIPFRSEFAFLIEKRLDQNQGLRWEVFKDIPGDQVAALEKSESFQENRPDERSVIEQFEIPSNVGENYGGRLTGWLIPPVTGEYVFYMSADNHARLFLGNSEASTSEEPIANLVYWTYQGIWQSSRGTLHNPRKSRPIHLERGKRYSIRALFKEGTGGDRLAVTWQIPGQPPPENGDPPIPGLFLRHSPE